MNASMSVDNPDFSSRANSSTGAHCSFTIESNPGTAGTTQNRPHLMFGDYSFSMQSPLGWLHNRPAEEVYTMLIDTYRLYLDDRNLLTGKTDADTIYGGAQDSREGFRKFLRCAERRPGILPCWWSPRKATDCESQGLKGTWSSLAARTCRKQIIEHYGYNAYMQMKWMVQYILGDQWDAFPPNIPGFE